MKTGVITPARSSASNRRSFLKAAAGIPALLAGCSQGPEGPEPGRAGRPNVVFLWADDMGYADLSSYGAPDTQTPHIDAIGEQGVRFTQFYANGPECSPTRTAFLTGRYQQRVGGLECAIGIGDVGRYDDAIWLAEQGELGLPVSESILPAALKTEGYDTACFGKWHLGYPEKFWPNRHGFDEFFGILGGNCDYFTHREQDGANTLQHNGEPVEREGYMTDLIADEAIAWLKKRPSGKPFFLYVPFTVPHTPIQGPDDEDKQIIPETWNDGDRAGYVEMVEHLDKRVGDIVAELEAMGAADNTLLIFASDNGGTQYSDNGPFRDRKSSLWEGGIRVPCMVRWPGVIPAGQTTSQLGMTFDLTATILRAAGAPAPGRGLDGLDLLPIMKGGQETFARTVFWRSKRGTRFRKAARDGDLKYVWDDGTEELHNIAEDPSEQRDLLAEAPDSAQELKAKLADWERDVMAPRLRPFKTEPG